MKFKLGDIVIITGSNAELKEYNCNPKLVTGYIGKITGFSALGTPQIDEHLRNCVRDEWLKLAEFAKTELYKALQGE